MAFSSILRVMSRKATANSPSNNYYNNSLMIKRALSSSVVSSASTLSSSPWLMLPPANDNMVHNFYSLAENKVLSLTTNSIKSFMGKHINDVVYVSSSHGWLTLFNRHNCDLFLFNPLSGRHVKLPSIHTLPIPKQNLRGAYGCITKLITSCSPEQQHCRVIMSFGPEDRLAFCSPSSSSSSAEWTPIGALCHEQGDDTIIARSYQDFVYSSWRKRFYCITRWNDFVAWDLEDDTRSPKCIPIEYSVNQDNYPLEDMDLKKKCIHLKSLVFAEESGDIFCINWNLMGNMCPDGSYFDFDSDPEAADKLPYKTIGFDAYKYDEEKCELKYMDGSLDGYAFFIGNNQSFAISAATAASTGLKPNSIYFADTFALPKWVSVTYGGHDIGIFNYEDRTFSPCYYPCDRQSIKRIIPSPMWFAPTN